MSEAKGPRAESKGHRLRIRYAVYVTFHALPALFWSDPRHPSGGIKQGDLTNPARIMWLSEH